MPEIGGGTRARSVARGHPLNEDGRMAWHPWRRLRNRCKLPNPPDKRSPGKARNAGFSLLETVVALAIFGAGAMALYGLFNTNLIALERVQVTAERLPVARSAVEVLSTVNPWQQNEGRFEIDGYQVIWAAELLAPVRHGQNPAGIMGDFDLGLYEIEFTVVDGERRLGSWRMRSVGYERVRGQEPDEFIF